MNVKKEVEMWVVTQIFDYAMQFYSEYIGDSKNERAMLKSARNISEER